MEDLFTNVHGFADADYDLDLDFYFHESERIFFDKLGFVKREEGEPAEEDEADRGAEESK